MVLLIAHAILSPILISQDGNKWKVNTIYSVGMPMPCTAPVADPDRFLRFPLKPPFVCSLKIHYLQLALRAQATCTRCALTYLEGI